MWKVVVFITPFLLINMFINGMRISFRGLGICHRGLCCPLFAPFLNRFKNRGGANHKNIKIIKNNFEFKKSYITLHPIAHQGRPFAGTVLE